LANGSERFLLQFGNSGASTALTNAADQEVAIV